MQPNTRFVTALDELAQCYERAAALKSELVSNYGFNPQTPNTQWTEKRTTRRGRRPATTGVQAGSLAQRITEYLKGAKAPVTISDLEKAGVGKRTHISAVISKMTHNRNSGISRTAPGTYFWSEVH